MQCLSLARYRSLLPGNKWSLRCMAWWKTTPHARIEASFLLIPCSLTNLHSLHLAESCNIKSTRRRILDYSTDLPDQSLLLRKHCSDLLILVDNKSRFSSAELDLITPVCMASIWVVVTEASPLRRLREHHAQGIYQLSLAAPWLPTQIMVWRRRSVKARRSFSPSKYTIYVSIDVRVSDGA